ncbi:MAG: riboflavin biosynthesis protein RibF [Omnitrophica bacterium RIFCSPLOWO2_12_FULL_44_17]|uniref:Riboflavin biosynthesis protein n=1 Tax=Candidatus Danuiimicrobium aquiferis TaxID=1801832 RepID=A0A1G1KYR1_9BACT|nr:MAG: riboflavin biosynthesis protein RibF [Omnitrophica bacterium RIFCSPHIGHO2_02_FULL_45_28]OGW89241.1 MAG: riboflavin biosynthesis protein RibF [Omnitrophica bacterium RIFCSPHIGHO2_12_FULL_44_12]OGW98040.1 MAG: riboflavin biosynthesis protein RibF [Omnitrophica bacterium RIFCSPLOWO2_12_FULL_44_17]OGX03516.1 MAG: riboflavin biosynthesis protein RibF [Omnitrophica bacterium RIFCSPLOWO2_02_FULL_44_11]
MKIITDLSHYRKMEYPNLVLALGNFDGFHRGHQEIVRFVTDEARKIKGTAAVLTFKQHPRRVLAHGDAPTILTSMMHKLYLLHQASIELCFLLDFSAEFARTGADEFVRHVLMGSLGVKEVCLGFNAHFGNDRRGNAAFMKPYAAKGDFKFHEIKSVMVGSEVASSTLIRKVIQQGDLGKAQMLLGKPYSFFGEAVSGHGRGKMLGYPTANLDTHSETMPPEGIYAVWIRVIDCEMVESSAGWHDFRVNKTGKLLSGVMYYGKCPTFEKDGKPVPEVHILDYHDELKGALVEVTVGACIRGERTFTDQESLCEQIEKDVTIAKKWLDEHPIFRIS